MKSLNLSHLFIIATICFASACNKDKNNNKQVNCRLKSLLESRTGGNTSWDFTYNSEGKMATITTTSDAGVAVKEFSYTGNTIIAVSKLANLFYGKDSLTLDAKGRPVNVRRYFTSGSWENTALEYNGDILSKYDRSYSSNPTPVTRVVTYANGNPVSFVSATNTATYEYFPEKTQVGDYMNLNQGFIDFGFGLYPHQNLMKSSSSGGSTTTAVYEKNTDGLIVKATVIAAGNELKYDYLYDCK